MSNVLVTGGAGFIGSHLADYLMKSGHDVVILDDFSGGYLENLSIPFDSPHGLHIVPGSFMDHSFVNTLFRTHKFDYVYHLGAYAAEGLSPFIKRFNYKNNLIGSVNLINAAVNNGVKRFVFTSSMAVYGENELPFRESHQCRPCDSYGIAKYAVEQELAQTREMFGLDYVIFRPHNVIGERQNLGDRYRNVAAIFMWQALNGQPMTIYGDGSQVRAFSDVLAIVPFIADCVHRDDLIGETFNIGGDVPISINELATLVAESLGVERRVIHLEERSEVKYAYCSHDHLEKHFGPVPHIETIETLKRMADWARKNVSRFQHRKVCDPEITKNLPSYWR